MDQTRIVSLLRNRPTGETVEARGWVRTRRESKGVAFLEVNDGSCLASLQVVIDRSSEALEAPLQTAQTGASVRVTGTLEDSPKGEQAVELHATALEVIGEAQGESYPLQKKRHSFEYLREIAHLRPRTNTFGAIARVRNTLSFAVHRFFQEHGFLYVHTPIITASDAEGAGEMFRVRADIDGREFFGKPTYLTVSGQLEAEIYAMALDRVYTFGPTFRAENSNTSRHLAEFWMIEPEMAFCDLRCLKETSEAFLKYILEAALSESAEDLAFFDKRIRPGLLESLRHVVETPFIHVTYTEAIEQLQNAPAEFQFEPAWGSDLQSEHERYLTEELHGGPVIVTDYPKQIKAFYMKQNDDGRTVGAMDILVPRLGEIIGGSQREDSLEALEERIAELGLPAESYWWYLDLRRYGSVEHSGFGLGFERLVQYVTGMQNIRDVIPFPRAVGTAEF
jgi:asparaginyl-tRNA synthetase